mmetsp:Transcript_6086/g.14228  ORF Transcript_6086/g.14228 Transcript_6086/m.14228 type:complete len:288 (+) Transcript_6086:172-1035(+)
MAAGSILSSSSNILTSIALKKVVKPPNMVANALDWKKASGGVATAMAIDIHADRIGLALGTLENNNHNNNHSNSITSDYDSNDATMMKLMMRGSTTSSHHPSSLDQQQHHNHYLGYGFSCTVLDSILLVKEGDESSSQSNNNSNIRRKRKKKVVPREDKLRLSGLVREHNVCGFVVSWPIQQDTGLMGASCGRTLWTLEQLLFDGGGDDDDRVTPEVIAFLLEQVGEKTTEGWVLKVHDDATFAERYPQTTLVHLQHWAKQIECFGPMIERYRADAEGGGGGMDASN